MSNTLGQVESFGNCVRTVCIMAPTVADVAAPTVEADGIDVYPTRAGKRVAGVQVDDGLCFPSTPSMNATLMIKGTCTAGQVLVGTFTLWGYHPQLGWLEIPVNGGTAVTPVALAETETDKITFVQQFTNLGHYKKLALQLASIGGGGASFEAWMTNAQEAY